ncbi:hypothetical protein HPP92_026171, partial [Vanilla planifolia]
NPSDLRLRRSVNPLSCCVSFELRSGDSLACWNLDYLLLMAPNFSGVESPRRNNITLMLGMSIRRASSKLSGKGGRSLRVGEFNYSMSTQTGDYKILEKEKDEVVVRNCLKNHLKLQDNLIQGKRTEVGGGGARFFMRIHGDGDYNFSATLKERWMDQAI